VPGDAASTTRLPRRAVLAGLAGVAAAAAVGAGWLSTRLRTDAWIGVRHRPLGTVPADEALVPLGQAYLADHPGEADADALVASVPALDGATSRADVVAALPAIAPAAAAEIEAGDLVTVRGWRLARSEARVAAAAALLPA
jgi:hypothetical protein